MERLTGRHLDVHLKCGEIISGLLFDTDDRHIYIQGDINVAVIIPRDNIKYYVSEMNAQRAEKITVPEKSAPTVSVYIDGEWANDVPIPENISIATCSEQLLQCIYANEGVIKMLKGRIQKTLEYDVGRVNIFTYSNNISDPARPKIQNSFGMGISNSNGAMPFDIAKTISGGNKNET